MHSPAFSTFDIQSHRTADTLEALQTLLYLIQLDASDPAQVKSYAQEAERIVRTHFEFGSEYPC
jgi:hypothetical protein